jgi:hypothetical protein
MNDEKRKKVYLSGPITGLDAEIVERNFRLAESVLPGDPEIFNPLKNGLSHDAPREDHLRKDIEALMKSDLVVFLGGWEKSRGCLLEHHIASELGIKCFYLSQFSNL